MDKTLAIIAMIAAIHAAAFALRALFLVSKLEAMLDADEASARSRSFLASQSAASSRLGEP